MQQNALVPPAPPVPIPMSPHSLRGGCSSSERAMPQSSPRPRMAPGWTRLATAPLIYRSSRSGFLLPPATPPYSSCPFLPLPTPAPGARWELGLLSCKDSPVPPSSPPLSAQKAVAKAARREDVLEGSRHIAFKQLPKELCYDIDSLLHNPTKLFMTEPTLPKAS